MRNPFKIKLPKYEVYMISHFGYMANIELLQMQEQGWEIAGNITTYMGNNRDERMIIPLKRRIN